MPNPGNLDSRDVAAKTDPTPPDLPAEQVGYEMKRALANARVKAELLTDMQKRCIAFVDDLYSRTPRYEDGECSTLSFECGFTGSGRADEDLITCLVKDEHQKGL